MALDIAIWIMYFVAIYFAVHWLLVVLERGISDFEPKAGKWPSATIVMPMWNEERSAVETLQSLVNLDYPREKLQIILVDDGCTDNTHAIVNNYLKMNEKNLKGLDIQYIKHLHNQGKGASLNTGLQHAKGELFICMDADSFVEPQALKKIAPYFEEEAVASVLPVIKLKKVHGFVLSLQYVEYLVNFFLKKVMSSLDCVHVTPGPFGVYRKKALQDAKGFDTNNLTEDLEMALRLQKNNYKIIQLMGVKVWTLAPESIKGWFKQRNRWYKGTLLNLYAYKSMFFKKRYGEFGLFQLPMVLGAALLSLFFAFFIIWQKMLNPLLVKIYNLSFINFDVGLMTNVWWERFSFLDLSYMLLFFTLLVFAFGVLWICYAFKYTEERFTKKGFVSSATFMVIYPFFLSMVWLGVIFDLMRNKRQKW